MLTRLDWFVIWLVTIVVVPSVTFMVAVEGPQFARCTEVALHDLENAAPLNRHPPAILKEAILDEFRNSSLSLFVARSVGAVSECHGPFSYNFGRRVWAELVLSWWYTWRFGDDLVALFADRAYLGHNTFGFAAAARYYYGRELDQLSADELRCLARKTRAPSSSRYACNGM